jgi:hypothetical protein
VAVIYLAELENWLAVNREACQSVAVIYLEEVENWLAEPRSLPALLATRLTSMALP